jgi:hypothetical protein
METSFNVFIFNLFKTPKATPEHACNCYIIKDLNYIILTLA